MSKEQVAGVSAFFVEADGPLLFGEADALDLIGYHLVMTDGPVLAAPRGRVV